MSESILKKGNRYKIIIHIFFIIFCLCFIIPMLMVVSIAFSSEEAVTKGFSLIPKEWSVDAFKLAFRDPSSIIDGYIVTIAQSVLGTVGCLVVMGLVAYPMSRRSFAYRTAVTWYVFATMLFGAGMIPTYIIFTAWYGLKDSFWVYVIPGLAGGAWNTLMIRTFFYSIPESLFESAKIDGAKELTIFFKIALPLSTPVFASLGFMILVGKWNDWMTSSIYITTEKLYTLQWLLQRILNEASYLNQLREAMQGPGSENMQTVQIDTSKQPEMTLRYAMCLLAAGPMLAIFPFFQKYFSKGIVVGAVKG